MKNSLCLIMLGGHAPGLFAERELFSLLEEHPYVVAADKGAEHLLQLGLTPQLVIGDGDSLSKSARAACKKSGAEFINLPREKDQTDAEAAVCAVFAAGYNHLAVFGAFGGRIDHMLGNVLLPLSYKDKWESCIFYGEGCTAFYCFGHCSLKGQPGDTVSLLPLSATIKNITLQGFKYALYNHDLELGSSLCLSNELTEEVGRITFDNGIMLIIHYFDLTTW
ncbi:MAG: thiamine diphosphokinase [Firmicutes bacterium]|nr:thiamine diphosphokinase [Bacillota bacterium]